MTKSMSHLAEAVRYESTLQLHSSVYPTVSYRIRRPSFLRRSQLISQVRELGRSLQFLEASPDIVEKLEAVRTRTEINRLYLQWGLESISGLLVDGEAATVELLLAKGPEDLTNEILEQIKRQCSLSEPEIKN